MKQICPVCKKEIEDFGDGRKRKYHKWGSDRVRLKNLKRYQLNNELIKVNIKINPHIDKPKAILSSYNFWKKFLDSHHFLYSLRFSFFEKYLLCIHNFSGLASIEHIGVSLSK